MKILLLPLTLHLLTCCVTPVSDTIDKARGKCDHDGAKVTVLLSNHEGQESLRIRCAWVVEEESFDVE